MKNYRNYPEIEVPLWTGSPVPDIQTAVEKFSVIAGACERGATLFGRLGTLCIDDVFSPEQLLADVEMIDYGRKRATAFSNIDNFMDMEGLDEEVTDFIKNDNSFMMADSTLKHLRSLYPAPGAFVHKKMASMTERGFSSFIKEMSEKNQDALKKYDFNLDESKQRALDKIYSDAERLLTKI